MPPRGDEPPPRSPAISVRPVGALELRLDGWGADAALAQAALLGGLDVVAARIGPTLDLIVKRLDRGGLIDRHESKADTLADPCAPFVFPTFWLAGALAATGRDGSQWLAAALATRGPLGLFGEVADPVDHSPLGNYPQVQSHAAFVLAVIPADGQSSECRGGFVKAQRTLRTGDRPVRSEFDSDRESATICLRERGSGQAEQRTGRSPVRRNRVGPNVEPRSGRPGGQLRVTRGGGRRDSGIVHPDRHPSRNHGDALDIGRGARVSLGSIAKSRSRESAAVDLRRQPAAGEAREAEHSDVHLGNLRGDHRPGRPRTAATG